MKTNMATTSLQAYHNPDNAVKRMTQRDKVLNVITQQPNVTARDVAKVLGIEHSTAAGRINELKNAGLVEVSGIRNGAKQVRAVEAQGELFH